MLSTMHRDTSTQPAAAVAAKDRATVELVLQKVHAQLAGLSASCIPHCLFV